MKTISTLVFASVFSAGAAWAGPATIWAVDASANGSGVSNAAYAEQFSLSGALLQRVSLGSGFNPTGIAIIGSTAYVSSDSSGALRTFNVGTGALGATYATGQNALGALTTDGTTIWASDFTGGNRAYQFSTTGASLGSVVLGSCSSYCNGLEFETGALIANRGQNVGPYDRYSTAGALQTASVFNIGDGGALAYSSELSTQYAAVSGGSGGFQTSPGGLLISFGGTPVDTGFGAQRFINDLAIQNSTPNQVPEPATLGMLLATLGLAGLGRRRA